MLNAWWSIKAMNVEISRVYNSSHVTKIIKGITARSNNARNPMVELVGFGKFRVNEGLFAGARAR
jgi:nucleoid DNA-binding protein